MAKKARRVSNHDEGGNPPSPDTAKPVEEEQPMPDVTLNNASTETKNPDEEQAGTHDQDQNLVGNSVSRIKASETLEEMVCHLPTLQDYVTKAEADLGKIKNIWQEGTGKARLTWGERETMIMLACILQVEKMAGQPIEGNLIDVKKGKIVRVPVKSVDNSLSKTVQTYIAWTLRGCGNPLFADIDHAQVKNRWVKLKEIWDAINSLSNPNRSGVPFTYDVEKGFGSLDKDMGAEFDALAEGKVAKGHNLSQLAQDAKIAKEFRHGPWVYYKALAKIFDVKGGSSTVKGTYALDFVNRQKRKGSPSEASSKHNVEAQGQHEQGQEPPGQGSNDDGSNTAGGPSNHRQSKRAKSSHQGRTIDAIGELGESNKGIAAAFSKSLEQESSRTELEKQILQTLATTNMVKQAESTYRKQCSAAQVISELPEFRELSPERQFAVQDWILDKDHAEEFMKVIPAIRGAWLTRQLTTIGQGKIPE